MELHKFSSPKGDRGSRPLYKPCIIAKDSDPLLMRPVFSRDSLILTIFESYYLFLSVKSSLFLLDSLILTSFE